MQRDEIIAENQQLINMTVIAAFNGKISPDLNNYLMHAELQGWGALVAAIRRLVAGEHERAAYGELDEEDGIIIGQILGMIENPQLVVNHMLISAQQLMQQSPSNALQLAKNAASILPEDPNTYGIIGQILQSQNQLPQALEAYERSLACKQDQVIILLNCGVIQTELKRFDTAVTTFLKALEIDPVNSAAMFHLAYLYERSSRLEDAEDLVRRGLEMHPSDPGLLFMRARLHQRADQISEAIIDFDASISAGLHPEMLGEANARLGYLHDRLHQVDAAIEHIDRSNAIYLDRCGRLGVRGQVYLDEMAYHQNLQEAATDDVSASGITENSAVFLIGYPRSGTTLLNQILDSHPAILTMEEKPAAATMVNEFYRIGGRRPDALLRLSDDDKKHLRDVYMNIAAQYMGQGDGDVFVDKFPLNIVYLRLLHAVFPRSRYILALRHPCDSALSCYMHSFGVNTAMANFGSLESTVELFYRVMQSWRKLAWITSSNVLDVRYEDMVQDKERQMHRLVDYLGVTWDDNVTRFDTLARERGFIDTPSYDQVTVPIYDRSLERWQRYRKIFDPHVSRMREICETFGYPY